MEHIDISKKGLYIKRITKDILKKIVLENLEKPKKKYHVDKAKGVNTKYDKL